MFRTIDIIMICALIAGAAWTFKVKYDGEHAREELARLERRIGIEREALDILRADWSLLTSPDRLEKLAARYKDDLLLEPADPQQMGSFDEVPARADIAEPETEEGREADAGDPDTSVMTGSIAAAPGDGDEDAIEVEELDNQGNPMPAETMRGEDQ